MVYPFCHLCKGTKNMCGMGRCPLLERVREKVQIVEAPGREIEGPSPPSVFVGRYGYPRISIGPLASPLEIPMPERLESSSFLWDRSIEDVYSMRSSLIRGRYRLDVKEAGRGPIP